MARPAWDVKQAREAAGLKQVTLGRSLSLPDYTFDRIERSLLAPASTAQADAIIAALPTLSNRAQFELRSRLRRRQSHWLAAALPGIAGNYLSTPDSPALSLSGDWEMRAQLAMTSWTPVAEMAIMSKWVGSGNASYYWLFNAGGGLRTAVCADGSNGLFSTTQAPLSYLAGSTHWLRTTWRQSDGRVQQFLCPTEDGLTWVQYGTDAIIGAGISIFDGSSVLGVGARDNGQAPLGGKVRFAELRSGISGTGPILAQFDAQQVAVTGPRVPLTTRVLPQNELTVNEYDVETDTTGFNGIGSTVARTLADFNTGAASLEVTTGAGSNPSFSIGAITGGDFPAAAGDQWSYVLFRKQGPDAPSFQLKLAWYSAAHVFLSQTNPSFTPAGSWQIASTSGPAPAGTAYVVPIVTFTGTPGAGLKVLFDTFSLYKVGGISGAGAYSKAPGDVWTANGTGWSWAEVAA